MVSKSSEVGLASICPRAVYLKHKYGTKETKILKKGAAGHTNFTKDVEHSMYVQKHRSAYIAALILLILTILALFGAVYYFL